MNPTIHIQPDPDGPGYVINMADSEGNRYRGLTSYTSMEKAKNAVGRMRMDLNRAKVYAHEREEEKISEDKLIAGIGDPDDDMPNLITMTVPQLDAYAEAEGIEDYPKGENKPTKLMFLSNWLEGPGKRDDEENDA